MPVELDAVELAVLAIEQATQRHAEECAPLLAEIAAAQHQYERQLAGASNERLRRASMPGSPSTISTQSRSSPVKMAQLEVEGAAARLAQLQARQRAEIAQLRLQIRPASERSRQPNVPSTSGGSSTSSKEGVPSFSTPGRPVAPAAAPATVLADPATPAPARSPPAQVERSPSHAVKLVFTL